MTYACVSIAETNNQFYSVLLLYYSPRKEIRTEKIEISSIYKTRETEGKRVMNIIPEPTARSAVPGVSAGRGLLIVQ